MSDRRAMAVLFGTGLALRIALIQAFPAIFGGDTVSRLYYTDRFLIAHQLPAFQAGIVAVMRTFHDPLAARYWVALLGAAAGAAFYGLARRLVSPDAAFACGLCFGVHPYILALSTVPYSEILMLGALAAAFALHFAGRPGAASLALGLACLTRHEAWAACPALAADYGLARRKWIQAALLFGWAPLVWIAWNAGFSPAGTFVAEWPRSPGRLMRYMYLDYLTAKFTPLPVLALAAVALWHRPQGARWRVLLGFFALFLASVPFSAHGVPPDPERFITARTAQLPMAAAVLLAGAGFERVQRYRRALLAVTCLWGAAGAAYFLHREVSDPRVRLAADTARYLDAVVGPGETALVLAPGPSPARVQGYLDQARRKQAGREAERILASFAEPTDYLRIWLHCRAARDRLRWRFGEPADWLVLWSDYTGPLPPAGAPAAMLRHTGLEVRVYRTPR